MPQSQQLKIKHQKGMLQRVRRGFQWSQKVSLPKKGLGQVKNRKQVI